jgi:hypothetical protein
MKKPSVRRRAASASASAVPVRHQFDHAVPTVIHNPEEKMTALGRWVSHLLRDRKRYSTWAVVFAVVAVGALAGWNYWLGPRPATSEVWTKLDAAKRPEDRVEIVRDYPNTPASTWGVLQAANQYFDDAIKDLPNNKDVAVPNLGKAVKLYEQVLRDAPKDSYQARAAAMGKARSLEARNDLPKAIEEYERLARDWPGTSEAERSAEIAKALREPGAAAFYKELFAYSPPKVTLPPAGSERLDFPMTNPGSRLDPLGRSSSLSNLPLELTPPSLAPMPRLSVEPGGKAGASSPARKLPDDVFGSKATTDTSKAPR